jgi:hypothetical protein
MISLNKNNLLVLNLNFDSDIYIYKLFLSYLCINVVKIKLFIIKILNEKSFLSRKVKPMLDIT